MSNAAWILTGPSGRVLHFSEVDGWKLDVVSEGTAAHPATHQESATQQSSEAVRPAPEASATSANASAAVADPEQPSAALADELEERARTRVQLALFSVPPLKAEDTVEWRAARALRTLSRELFDLRTAALRHPEPAPRGEPDK